LKIRSLSLEGFRSFEAERIDFDELTFLVGRNGSGKSNLVDAFQFLSDIMYGSIPMAVSQRGGIEAVCHRPSLTRGQGRIAMRIDFDGPQGTIAHYAFETAGMSEFGLRVEKEQCHITSAGETDWFDRTQGGLQSSQPGVAPLLDPGSLALPILGGVAAFAPLLRTLSLLRVYVLLPGRLRDPQKPGISDRLLSDGSNAVNVLHSLEKETPGDLDRLSEWLSAMVPGTTRVRTEEQGGWLTLKFEQNGQPVPLDALNMSDGTLRLVGLLAAVFQKRPPSVLVIEEPEANLHPGALGSIGDLLQLASRKTQVIATTHSPEILDAKWIEDRHLRIVHWENGASRVSPIAEGARRALQEHLFEAGELLRSEVLDAPPLPLREGPLPSLFEELR
jgi:predicted ATPase